MTRTPDLLITKPIPAVSRCSASILSHFSSKISRSENFPGHCLFPLFHPRVSRCGSGFQGSKHLKSVPQERVSVSFGAQQYLRHSGPQTDTRAKGEEPDGAGPSHGVVFRFFQPTVQASSRYRKVTAWARDTGVLGLNVVAVVPLVMPFATAHSTAS